MTPRLIQLPNFATDDAATCCICGAAVPPGETAVWLSVLERGGLVGELCPACVGAGPQVAAWRAPAELRPFLRTAGEVWTFITPARAARPWGRYIGGGMILPPRAAAKQR